MHMDKAGYAPAQKMIVITFHCLEIFTLMTALELFPDYLQWSLGAHIKYLLRSNVEGVQNRDEPKSYLEEK